MAGEAKGLFPYSAEGLVQLVQALRKPDGCPWDRKQTLESLRSSMTGECAEVIEAVDLGDRANLCEELGDLLMNVVFMAVIAGEEGSFSWSDVCREVIDKMVRRHEHVFGAAHAENAEEVVGLWQKIKATEKGAAADDSIYAKKVLSLSALDRASEIQKRAAKVNFDWDNVDGVMAKVQEETAELAEAMASGNEDDIDEELGDLLFAAVNLARFRRRASADELLRRSCRKFVDRFQSMEKMLSSEGKKAENCTAEELESYYKRAKAQENAKKNRK
ncbi:MAG: nucleoside triphosphate pyrophosphohydrolase [Lentisphaerae bacterium]|nr:nucleoside triphosphate pyrophosphohydrolase [Lentisphaerota bacterium]